MDALYTDCVCDIYRDVGIVVYTFVNPSTACLDAEYAENIGPPLRPNRPWREGGGGVTSVRE